MKTIKSKTLVNLDIISNFLQVPNQYKNRQKLSR